MESDDVEESYNRLESKIQRLKKLDNTKYIVAVAPVLAAAIIIGLLLAPQPAQNEVQATETELTGYQQEYVDCPAQYLDICTRMSKIPTEELSFIKTEGGRIHLRLQDGRRLVARLPEEDHNGYLIRISRDTET